MTAADRIEKQLRDNTPWLELYTNVAGQADLAAKAQQHQQAIEAICQAANDPTEARRLWETSFPRGGGSVALLEARRRRFCAILVSAGLLTRQQVDELWPQPSQS